MYKNLLDLLKNKIKKHYTLIIFSFCILGLTSLIRLFLSVILTPINLNQYPLNSYILNFFNTSKYAEILIYIVNVCITGLLYVLFFFKNKNREHKNSEQNFIIFYSIVIYNSILVFLHTSKVYYCILFLIVWIILTFYQQFKNFISKIKDASLEKTNTGMTINKNTIDSIYKVIFCVLIVQFILLFYPYVFQKPKIMNEFLNIPETTIIKTDNEKIEEIDNIDYINTNQLLGFHKRYDIRNPQKSLNEHCVTFSLSQSLNNLINRQKYEETFITKNFVSFHNTNKYYLNKNKELCLIGNMNDSEYIHFNLIAKNENDEQNISKLLKKSHLYDEKQYTIVQKEIENKKDTKKTESILSQFNKNNSKEIHWQILNRYYFHHQNHLYGPINELNLGKDINQIFFQYGKYNGIILSKIINYIGGLDFENYMKVLYSSYYLYYFVFVFFVFLLFKKNYYVLPILLLTFGALHNITGEILRIAPGMSPLRHFFDIFVFISAYTAFIKKSNIGLFITALLCILSILNEATMGLFISIAFYTTILIRVLTSLKRKKFDVALLCILPVLFYGAYKVAKVSVDYVIKYFKLGLIAFPISSFYYTIIIVSIIVLYAVLIKYFIQKEEKRYSHIFISVMLFIYSQELLLYYVWCSIPDHIFTFIPIYALTVLSFINLYFIHNSSANLKKIEFLLLNIIMIFSIIFYINGYKKNYDSEKEFNKIFDTHKVYEWIFPRTNFISTMNPKYFMDSVKIIQKYSKDNKIYILSKYDSFIPFIAGKYSGMPFFEVSNFLVSKDDINICISQIEQDKPEYLYTDRDIDRDMNTDMISSSAIQFGYLFLESEWRSERLTLMKNIFDKVKNDYEPLESSYLLTVWKRKS